MNASQTTKKATEYMMIWNANSSNQLDVLADENIVVSYSHFPQSIHGVEAYKEALQQTYSYFPDIAIETTSVIPSEEAATVLWRYTGTHKAGNLFGVEATKKQVAVSGITILEFKDGLVIKESGIVDNLSLIMQLGVLKA